MEIQARLPVQLLAGQLPAGENGLGGGETLSPATSRATPKRTQTFRILRAHQKKVHQPLEANALQDIAADAAALRRYYIESTGSFQKVKKITVVPIWGFQSFEPLLEPFIIPPVHAHNCKGRELDLRENFLVRALQRS